MVWAMKVSDLSVDLKKLLEDSSALPSVQRELEKARLTIIRHEEQISKLQQRLIRVRKRDKKTIDLQDEHELFRSQAKLRFTSHITGVRALHIKARGFGKMFTSRALGDDVSLLGEAMGYLREKVWT